MFRNQPYSFLSAVGAVFGLLLLAAPAGAGLTGIEISSEPPGSERDGHTVQENIPPKPPIGKENPPPPRAPWGLFDLGGENPSNGDGWSSGDEWFNLLPPPMLRNLPLSPPSGQFGGPVGPHLILDLPNQPHATTPGALRPIPAPGVLGLLGLGGLAWLGRRRR
jgi:uncharacterized protein (TIGR03382 family)